MARYIGPKTRIARKFREPIYGPDKYFEKKNFPPGMHGNSKRRKKQSEYGIQLQEKQKAKYTYGILEKQFHNLFVKASHKSGITGEVLLQLIEARLDNVVYRLGFATSRNEARQFVLHGHIMVNGRKVNIPSYQVDVEDLISVNESSRKSNRFKDVFEYNADITVPEWLSVDLEKAEGKVLALPTRDDIDYPVQEHLIVEFYSR